MVSSKDLPEFIDNDTIKKVNEWMNRTLVTHDDKGHPDFKAMIHNADYNIGEVQTEASGLLMQEEGKLADMESAYDELRAEELEKLLNKPTGFEKTPERVNIILDGKTNREDPKKDLVKLKNSIKKQKAYIAHLKRYCEQVKYYTNGVNTIIETYKTAYDAGKI